MASLPMARSYEEWQATRSKHLRRKIRRTQAKADHAGLVTTSHEHVSPDVLLEIVGWVSARSWQGHQRSAVYTDPANHTFYRLLCDAPQLETVLHVVSAATGEPLAYVVGIRIGRIVHHVDTGYDQSAAAHSPGLLATLEGIKWACCNAILKIDLGIHADYKERLGPVVTVGEGVHVTRRVLGYLLRGGTTG